MIREYLKTLRQFWSDPLGKSVLAAILSVFVGGTAFYHYVESWTWLDSFYFTVVTLTTVGYGDLAPTKPISKIFTVILILIGVGAILAFLDLLVKRTVQRRVGQVDSDTE